MQAPRIATEVRPVACFLDLGMPGLDGLQLARRLRAGDNGSRVILIATTVWGQPDDKRRAEEAGFNLHLTKPIDVYKAAQEVASRLRTGNPAVNPGPCS